MRRLLLLIMSIIILLFYSIIKQSIPSLYEHKALLYYHVHLPVIKKSVIAFPLAFNFLIMCGLFLYGSPYKKYHNYKARLYDVPTIAIYVCYKLTVFNSCIYIVK